MKSTFIFAFILSLLSCKPATFDINQEVEPILRKNWDKFITAWENADPKTCAELYTQDGINVPPSSKINEGRNEIEDFYRFLFNNNVSSEYRHTILSLSGSQSDIIEYGKFKVEWIRNDSTSWTYHARTMTHWVNQIGEWKIQKFIFNNPPEASNGD